MWKNRLSFDEAFNLVKSKRGCIDINIGFYTQLNKWNTLLKLNQDDKIYKIDEKRNLRIINKNEFKVKEMGDSFMLFIKNDKVYQLITGKKMFIDDKNNILVEIIKNYENCKEVCDVVNLDIENFNMNKLEELFKSLCF